MSFSVVIPARYASQRLPGKPLLDIAGKPMVQHVCGSVRSKVRQSGSLSLLMILVLSRLAATLVLKW